MVWLKGEFISTSTTNSTLTGWQYFIDATYEGDLIAVAKIPFFIGRESASVYGNELGAGKLYKYWNGPEGPGSTHDGDNAIQAYNYRLSITNSTPNAHKVTMPESYNRTEYLSLIGDIITGCNTAYSARGVCSQTPGDGSKRPNVPEQPNGISRIFSPSKIPNGKLDANNEHLSFISTDLPEENWSYPTATWEWRDTFALRLRSYTLGLIYFAQNDDKVPAWFRNDIKDWGLANDEYEDNGFFPRQVYVREGRRMHGEYIFTSRDALPVGMGMRPPIHNDSVSSSHYALDSHGVRKREEGKINLDGLQSRKETEPYTVPYRVIIPQKTEMSIGNVLAPVPVSGSHIGFSTLRMEPCWMALGQAAGLAVAQLLKDDASGTRTVHDVDIKRLQHSLHEQGAVLVYDSSWAKLSKSEREKKELALLASAGQQITSPVAKSPVTGTSGPGPGLQLQQNLLY